MTEFADMDVLEVVKMFAPLLIIQVSFQVFCLINLIKNGVANLSKLGWSAIVVLGGIIGCIIYLIVGKRRGYDD